MGFSQSRIAYISSTSGDSPAHSNLHPRGPLNGGRYKVLGMLGRGATSTVWLVHDESSPRLVAVKLVAASPSGENHEREIRQLLANAATWSHDAGYKYVQHMSDSFEEHGWFYHHRCLVGAPAGAFSLSSSKEASCGVGLFPLEVSRAMAAQLILAVGFLHSQGVVHGDIHLGNILVALPPCAIQAYSSRPTFFSGWFSSILATGAGSAPGPSLNDYFDKPSHELTLRDAHILLTDFGEAWQPASSEKFALRTPYVARAPEAYFAGDENRSLGAAADAWALACALFAIYAQRTLFEFVVSADAAAALREAVSALGPMPAAWAGAPIVPPEVFPLERRVQEVRSDRHEYARWFADDEPDVGDDELADIGDMLAAMLKWDPEDRVSAARVAEGQWMGRWGRPAMEKVDKEVGASESSF